MSRLSALILLAALGVMSCIKYEVNAQFTILVHAHSLVVLESVENFAQDNDYKTSDPSEEWGNNHPMLLYAAREDGMSLAVSAYPDHDFITIDIYQSRRTFDDSGKQALQELLRHLNSAFPANAVHVVETKANDSDV